MTVAPAPVEDYFSSPNPAEAEANSQFGAVVSLQAYRQHVQSKAAPAPMTPENASALGLVLTKEIISKLISDIEATPALRLTMYGDAMPDPTREEFDAKLATVEARAETRFVELSGKLDRVADSITSLTGAIGTIRTEVKEDNKLTRWTIIGLVIAGLGVLWLTQANLLASFSAGIALHEAKPTASPSSPK